MHKMTTKRLVVLQCYATEREGLKVVIPLAPYKWDELKDTLTVEWMAYSQYLHEHIRELSNSINEFRQYILSLTAWSFVLDKLKEEEKYHAIIEYITPLATLALNIPYVIRSRFIYSVAHLSHQANQSKVENWKDDLPIDDEIYFDQADVQGKYWKKYNKLKTVLESVSNSKYKKATHDFRNTYNHRYSPRIEIGLSGFVKRIVKSGRVTYGYGETEPLLLRDIVPLLTEQHELLLKAYTRYQALVNEQVTVINNA